MDRRYYNIKFGMQNCFKAEKPFSFNQMAKIDERIKEYLREVIHTGIAVFGVIFFGLLAIGAGALKAAGFMN